MIQLNNKSALGISNEIYILKFILFYEITNLFRINFKEDTLPTQN